jgi:hypothetical protein
MTDKDGKTFYFNKETRMTRNEPPKGQEQVSAEQQNDALSPHAEEAALVPIDFDNCRCVQPAPHQNFQSATFCTFSKTVCTFSTFAIPTFNAQLG